MDINVLCVSYLYTVSTMYNETNHTYNCYITNYYYAKNVCKLHWKQT